MKIKELFEMAGGMSSGDIATVIKGGSGSNVGTLFGGSYHQKRPKKKAQKPAKESLLRR